LKPLGRADILEPDRYERVRETYRAHVIAHKAARRVEIGDRISLAFEDRETIRYQIQEMARVEGSSDDARIQGELDVYNDLIPGRGELSATLFIEIPQLDAIRSELERLVGIDGCVALVLGDEPESRATVPAEFDRQQLEADRISAVHYLRFRLSEEQITRLESGERARFEVDHANYHCDAEVGEVLRAQLVADLRDRPAQLLDPASVPEAPASEILQETADARVRRGSHPNAKEHLIVEGLGAPRSLADASAEEWAPVFVLAQQVAREMRQRHTRCRLIAEIGPAESDQPLRFDVVAY